MTLVRTLVIVMKRTMMMMIVRTGYGDGEDTDGDVVHTGDGED